jgi:uncharacterized protein YegL
MLTAKRVFEKQEDFLRCGEIGMVLFNSTVQQLPFTAVGQWAPPTLQPDGWTHTAAALLASMDMLTTRLAQLNAQGVKVDRPYIVVISDGRPTQESQQAVDGAFAKARDFEAQGYAEFLLIGVEESDREHLSQMGLKNRPIIVAETNWETVFVWVSQRVSAPTLGQQPISLSMSYKVQP